jgi:hypothetical protein
MEESGGQRENAGLKDEKRNPDGTWKEGVSGNPVGKPKGVRHLSTLLKEALLKEGGDSELVKTLIKKAIEGNDRSIQEIFDRLEGKPQQAIDLNANIEKKLIKLDE